MAVIEGTQAILDGIVLAGGTGLPAEETGRGREAERPPALAYGRIEEVARRVIIPCIAELIGGSRLEHRTDHHGRTPRRLFQQLDIHTDIHVAGAPSGILCRVGKDAARLPHGSVILPELHHRHPERQVDAVGEDRNIRPQEQVVGIILAVRQMSPVVIPGQFHGQAVPHPSVRDFRDREGIGTEPARSHSRTFRHIRLQDGCLGI